MRRSFGGSNQGMGGGNGGIGGGGGMLRSVARAVTRARVGGLQEPFSSSSSTTTTTAGSATSSATKKRTTHKPNSTTNLLSLSSSSLSSASSPCSPFSAHTLPFSANSSFPNWPHCDEFEWVSVDGSEDGDVVEKLHHGYFDDFVLGSVPSLDEVQVAVSALQQAKLIRDMHGASSDRDAGDHTTSTAFGSELDWIEPSILCGNSRMLQPHGCNRVYDAFHLLQADKSVQRMVISLSSDKAVWDAVLSNEVVRELKESLDTAEDYSLPSSDEGSDGSNAAMSIVKWIFESTKAKATELIQTIMKLVNHLFQQSETEKTGEAIDPFEEKLRSSFLLTVMVMLIVVVTRAHRA